MNVCMRITHRLMICVQLEGLQAECDEVVSADRVRVASLEQELEAVCGKNEVLKKALEDRRKDISDLRCGYTLFLSVCQGLDRAKEHDWIDNGKRFSK